MEKIWPRIMMLVTGTLFLCGIIIVFSATSIGLAKGEKAIRMNGGSIETNKYNWVVQSNTQNYRSGGSILAIIGGVGVVLSGVAVYRDERG